MVSWSIVIDGPVLALTFPKDAMVVLEAERLSTGMASLIMGSSVRVVVGGDEKVEDWLSETQFVRKCGGLKTSSSRVGSQRERMEGRVSNKGRDARASERERERLVGESTSASRVKPSYIQDNALHWRSVTKPTVFCSNSDKSENQVDDNPST